ncbi:MAG TPA: hypothetical protein VEF76_08565 [Patescibacteria group bacterium]|nr:hypothetical protein [Patescibacteria group bacterium]
MSVFLSGGDEMEMYYSGPMRSGIVLDSQALLKAGYRDFQLTLAKTLDDLYLGLWECPANHARRSHLAFDVDNFQGETIIPRYLIARSFEDDDLDEILAEFHLPAEITPPHDKAHPVAGATFRIDKIAIFIYDYGYASCQLRGHVVAARDLTLAEYRAAAERISSALPDFSELFQSTMVKVAKTVPDQYLLKNYHLPADPGDGSWQATVLRQHIGELFWVHRVFSIPCRTPEEFAARKESCRVLAYGARSAEVKDGSSHPGIAFYPGFGNSCVVYMANLPENETARLRSLVRAKNVFYAALQDADRDLFYLGNENALRRVETAETLERELNDMAEALARTGFLKSVYDDYDNQLDPQSIALWDQLRMTWIMGDLFRALDQKAARMEKACDRTAHRLAALQSRRTGNLIAVFTALSLVSFALAIAGAIPAFRAGQAGLPEGILLAFALGTATLLTTRFFKAK